MPASATSDLMAVHRQHPLLQGLRAEAADFCGKMESPPSRLRPQPGQTLLLYCVSGSGWCDTTGGLCAIRHGDLAVLPPGTFRASGTSAANPWSIHWAVFSGGQAPQYLAEMGAGAAVARLPMGDDPELTRLFNEVACCLKPDRSLVQWLRAAHALGHLLTLVMEKRQRVTVADGDTIKKVAAAIIYMTEHLDEPPRVTALARLAALSPAHFGALFKQQTGSSPREYLHLLRIHRACQLLRRTPLSIKEIAARLGYQDQFHFSRQFKAFQGLSPTEYRGSPGTGIP